MALFLSAMDEEIPDNTVHFELDPKAHRLWDKVTRPEEDCVPSESAATESRPAA